jgi:two-component system OmpR family response regulator
MAGACTILIAREDLSIPGAKKSWSEADETPALLEARFFQLLTDHRPDVVVLDLTTTAGLGAAAIRTIHSRSTTPVLVVCQPSDDKAADYLEAGGSTCLSAPVDIAHLNVVIHEIIRSTEAAAPVSTPVNRLADLTLCTDTNTLAGPLGGPLRLTTAESDLLRHLLARGGKVSSRDEIASVLYGRYRPTSDRAVDTVVKRLRKKLFAVGGPAAQETLMTEFRRGYRFNSDLLVLSETIASDPVAAL